ncbi:MAG: hypothetical protein PHC75_01335 [Burkholderiales bacterium]|nr:hypothetical protein [Burkholderiales bacterium]
MNKVLKSLYILVSILLLSCSGGESNNTNSNTQELTVKELRSSHGNLLKSINFSVWNHYLSQFNDVAYGNGTYIVVGNGGAIYRSLDGKSWQSISGIASANLNAITYNKEKKLFYIVGDNGFLASSANGIDWSIHNQLNPPVNLTSITTVRLGDVVIGGEEGNLFELQLSKAGRQLIVRRETGDSGYVTAIAFDNEDTMIASTSKGNLYHKSYGQFSIANWLITQNGTLSTGISDVQHERTDDWFIATTVDGNVIQAQLAIDSKKGAYVNWSKPVNVGLPTKEDFALGASATSIALDPSNDDFIVVGGHLNNFARYSSDFNYWDNLGGFNDLSGFPSTPKLHKIKCFENNTCVAVGDLWTIVSGSGKSWSATMQPKITSTYIYTDNSDFIVGESANLLLFANFDSNAPVGNIKSSLVKWSSTDEHIASIKDGVLIPHKSGNVTIYADFHNHTAKYDIHVSDFYIKSIEPKLVDYRLNVNLARNIQIEAVAKLSNGESMILDNGSLICNSSDENLLLQSSAHNCRFNVKNIDDLGKVNITIKHKNLTTIAHVTITNENVSKVTIHADTSNLLPNSPFREFEVLASSGDDQFDVTDHADISVIDPSIISVYANKIYAHKPGKTQMIVKVGDITQSKEILVDDLSMDTPDTMSKGTLFTTTVKIINESGLTYDITDKATLSSSDSSIIELKSHNILVAHSIGDVTITASLVDGSKVSKNITVDAPLLQSLKIKNIPTAFRVGDSQELQLFGHYSDNSELAISESIAWTQSPSSIVSFNNNTIKGLQEGVATITASYKGLHVTQSFNVNNASLTHIAFAKPSISLVGLIGDYYTPELKAFYSDHSEQVLDSSKLNCVSSNSSIAKVTNGCTIYAGDPGHATISLVYKDKDLVPHSASFSVDVGSNKITSIELNFDKNNFIVGQTRPFTLTAIVAGKSYDVTNVLNVNAMSSTILKVDNNKKTITANSHGLSYVNVIYDGKDFVNDAVQVVQDSLKTLQISLPSASNINNLMPHQTYDVAISCSTSMGKHLSGKECGVDLTLSNGTGVASLSGNNDTGYKLTALKASLNGSSFEKGTIFISYNMNTSKLRWNLGVAPIYNSTYELSGTYSSTFNRFVVSDEHASSNSFYLIKDLSSYTTEMKKRLHDEGRYLNISADKYEENSHGIHWITYSSSDNTNLAVPVSYKIRADGMNISCNKSYIWKNRNNHFTVAPVNDHNDMERVVICDNVKPWHIDKAVWHNNDSIRVFYKQGSY